jgi:hypothetical protein
MRAIRATGLVLILAIAFASAARAVENGSSYDTTAPTDSDISNWLTGWTQPAGEAEGTYITGWNYVGQVQSGASGTYLGNGWVLTAGHVGAQSTITLDSEVYNMIPNSAYNVDNGSVDLTFFQISTTSESDTVLDLPALTLSTTDPVAFAYGTPGSQVAMLGYGGGLESWGYNTVTSINQLVTPEGFSYVSNDFFTALGAITSTNPSGPGSQSITNNAQLVGGDSGGGDFIYNSTTGQWELAGINEAVGTDNGQYISAFVQLDTYVVPEPSVSVLLPLSLALVWIMRTYLKMSQGRVARAPLAHFEIGFRLKPVSFWRSRSCLDARCPRSRDGDDEPVG